MKGFLLKFGAENDKKVPFGKPDFQKKDFLLATQKFSLFKSLKSYFYKSCLPGFIKVGRATHFHSAKIISFRIRNKTVNTSCYQIFVYLLGFLHRSAFYLNCLSYATTSVKFFQILAIIVY